MTESKYKVQGSGDTPSRADAALKKERSKLTKKLKSAKVSTKLNVTSLEYGGKYTLKKAHQSEETDYVAGFEVKSKIGWARLKEKARAHADIRAYDESYNITQFIDLTKEQKDAAVQKKRTTPAGEFGQPISRDGFASSLM